MEKRGVKTRLLEVPGAPSVVYGEILKPGARLPTPRDRSLEKDGKEIKLPALGGPAFDPEWRIYARSATDDKARIIAIVTALDAFQSCQPAVPLEFEVCIRRGRRSVVQESGQNHRRQSRFMEERCLADVRRPVHQSGKQQIVFGARGVETLDITVYGPRRELHSGHYGNWAPNPALMLVKLLTSMKKEDNRVLVDHFYDEIEPLSETEKRAVAEAPAYDQQLKHELWLGRAEGGGKSLVDLLNSPSLNIRGLGNARTGAQASNVIPSKANATIDMRLVKGIDHIRKQGYFVGEVECRELQRNARVRAPYQRR